MAEFSEEQLERWALSDDPRTSALAVEVKRLRRLEAVLPHIPDGTDPAKIGWWCGTEEQWRVLRASIVRNGDKPVGLTADVLRAALEAP